MRITIPLFFSFFSCTKKIGKTSPPQIGSGVSTPQEMCVYQNNTAVSYSMVIQPMVEQNCLHCHTKPGSGGINLDSYQEAREFGLSGQFIPVVANTDPMNIIMPPPPQQHLDSCQVKAVYLWIKQGCLNN